jgi:hypothetical protein
LKREYGNPVTVYQLLTVDTDYDSGAKTETHNSVYVRRAIVLPVTLTRAVIQSISMISANKQVVQGGTFDPGLRTFIIDRSDVPSDFDLHQDDWLTYDGERYDIKKVDAYEYKTAWLVQAKLIEGAPAYEDLHEKTNSYLLDLTQTVTAVIS